MLDVFREKLLNTESNITVIFTFNGSELGFFSFNPLSVTEYNDEEKVVFEFLEDNQNVYITDFENVVYHEDENSFSFWYANDFSISVIFGE